MIYNFTLSNGIRCIVKKIDGVFSVNMGIFVGVGSCSETPEENGISHFIEHVNFKGTNTRTSFDISHDSEKLGSQLNAFTSKEMTVFYIKSTKEHTAKSFEILADMFVNSTYPENELEKERGVIIEEINMYQDTPDEVCSDNLSLAYFGDGGYGSTILGPIDNVKSFTKSDIERYKSKYYTTDNIVISFVGNIEFELAKELCEKYFGDLPKTQKSQPCLVNTQNLCQNIKTEKDIEQVHISLSFNAVPINSQDADIYNILSNALGGGMSSRLFQEIREKQGLCYSIYSYLNLYQPCGNFAVYAGVNKSQYKKAFSSIVSELEKFKKYGITENEFLCAKEQIKSSFVYMQDNCASQMILYGKKLLFDNAVFMVDEKMQAINDISYEKTNEILKNNFDIQNIATSIVGKNIQKLK